MKLQDELDLLTEKLTAGLGDSASELFQGQIEPARALLATRPAARTGDRAPDFVLPNATGVAVRLSRMLEDGRVVLVFYRGAWCPYCNLELRAYQLRLPEIVDLGAQLVAITPEAPDEAQGSREKLGLEFEVLSDRGRVVAAEYGLSFPVEPRATVVLSRMGIHLEPGPNGRSAELPIPTTYVIDRDRTILLGEPDPDYRTRLEPDDVMDCLRRS